MVFSKGLSTWWLSWKVRRNRDLAVQPQPYTVRLPAPYSPLHNYLLFGYIFIITAFLLFSSFINEAILFRLSNERTESF